MSKTEVKTPTKTKPKSKGLPDRSQVKVEDTWDLSSLFPNDAAWEKAFTAWEKTIPGYEKFRGKLAESPAQLAALMKFDGQFDLEADRLGTYAHLKTTEDQGNSDYQRMMGRYRHAATEAGQAASYIRPELMKIPTAKMKEMLAAKTLAPYRLKLELTLRYKPYTLGKKEEELLAMQGQMSATASLTFRQLNDADLRFGFVKDENGEAVELTNSSFAVFLRAPKRAVRKAAFEQYYEQFENHKNTFAATLSGSIQRDIYYAKARGYQSAREASLFADNVPVSVYDNLISSVHSHLPALYRYYDLRRRKMKLKDIHHYDTYVPILSEQETRHTWNQAVKVIMESLGPLGKDYCQVLEKGLLGRWCDRYPNRGKQSGAFSSGTYKADPYILMNYQPQVLDHVFTLAHEAGHSMHSYLSSENQPYEYSGYTIFVAEVASTFNEQLLSRHLRAKAKTKEQRAALINHDIDAMRGTIFRQTMFAEFEKETHALAEAGEPLTVQQFQEVYRKLLEHYFGPEFALDPQLQLECFRIPHFYRAFYVYKYATGMSAAIALAERVTSGGDAERDAFLGFLKGGCSKFPLDLLRDAGVDMEQPAPVNTALEYFERLVAELDDLI